MTAYLNRIRKAIIAGIAAGGTALVAAWPDGVTADEWGKIAAAALVAGAATWAIPNAPKPTAKG